MDKWFQIAFVNIWSIAFAENALQDVLEEPKTDRLFCGLCPNASRWQEPIKQKTPTDMGHAEDTPTQSIYFDDILETNMDVYGVGDALTTSSRSHIAADGGLILSASYKVEIIDPGNEFKFLLGILYIISSQSMEEGSKLRTHTEMGRPVLR